MRALQPRRHTRARIPPSVHDVLPIVVVGFVQQRLDARLSETPRARIKRLFLAPNDVLGVRVHVEVFLELGPRERVELFDTGDGCVLVLLVCAVLVEGNVDLASTEDDSLNLFRRGNGFVMFRVRDDPLEVGFTGEVLDR